MKHLQLATTAQVALTLCLVASSAAASESSRRRDGQSAPPPVAPLVRTAGLDDGRTQNPGAPRTRVSIRQGRWFLNDAITHRGAKAEGLLMNVWVVNAVFEDANRPDFDPGANTEEFVARIPDYAAHGVRAFTLGLQGGFPGYEGAVNSAFNPDGSLRTDYMHRARRIIEACNRNGAVVVLVCYYQRQDQILTDEKAVTTILAGESVGLSSVEI